MAAAVHQPHNGLVNGDGVRDEGPAPHAEPYDYSVGTSIPANMAHAVSVSLPKWQDNVDYEEGRLTDVMKTGYPRFFVHRSIQKVSVRAGRDCARVRAHTDLVQHVQTFCSSLLYSCASSVHRAAFRDTNQRIAICSPPLVLPTVVVPSFEHNMPSRIQKPSLYRSGSYSSASCSLPPP